MHGAYVLYRYYCSTCMELRFHSDLSKRIYSKITRLTILITQILLTAQCCAYSFFYSFLRIIHTICLFIPNMRTTKDIKANMHLHTHCAILLVCVFGSTFHHQPSRINLSSSRRRFIQLLNSSSSPSVSSADCNVPSC